jgi:hypothetical protein
MIDGLPSSQKVSVCVERSEMPIFISYNHQDSAFVDRLARNLVLRRHNVWMDRWEMNVGDSLIDKHLVF